MIFCIYDLQNKFCFTGGSSLSIQIHITVTNILFHIVHAFFHWLNHPLSKMYLMNLIIFKKQNILKAVLLFWSILLLAVVSISWCNRLSDTFLAEAVLSSWWACCNDMCIAVAYINYYFRCITMGNCTFVRVLVLPTSTYVTISSENDRTWDDYITGIDFDYLPHSRLQLWI